MGLDMYLSKRNKEVGYWRKANHIHNWFVKNIQDGIDDCAPHNVTYEKLLELKEICEKVLKTKDHTLLPRGHGFFFGSVEIDEYYFEDIDQTIKIINALEPNTNYIYESSW